MEAIEASSVVANSHDGSVQYHGDELSEVTPLIAVRSSRFKIRHCIAIMGFAICFYFSASRINMSVTIVDMVNHSSSAFDAGRESASCPDLNVNSTHREFYFQRAEKFNWSPKIQGYILGCYYLIFILMQIPFGRLVERYGCKRFLVGGTIVDAILTLVIPTASYLSPYALVAVQIVRGAAQGTFRTSVTLLAANWFPKKERGFLFTSMLSGFSMGTFTGGVLSGFLCHSSTLGGWPSAFYVYGLAVLLLSGAIGYFIYDKPSSHPRITAEELTYIRNNQENDLSQERPKPPWAQMFKSVPVYALTVAYFGQNWALSQFLLVQSTFLGTILHYPIYQNGFYSAVPFLFMFLCTQTSSGLSTLMINKKSLSVNFTRKFWNFVACSGFSACLLGVYFAGCNRLLSIVFSVLSVGFIGFGQSGSVIASTDMSPKFAASLNAFCNMLGIMPCLIQPVIVGYLTNGMQTIEQWNKVFFLSIGVVMTSGAVFSLLGSAEVQRWNSDEDERRPSQ